MLNLDSMLTKAAEFIADLTGNGFDKSACKLPAFQSRRAPTAKIPDAPKSKPTGGDWVAWDGSRVLSEDSKAIDLTDITGSGITDREYGEMLAYNPPLRDLKLAAKVKAGKKAQKTLKEIAKDTRESEALIKHYSAALSRVALKG